MKPAPSGYLPHAERLHQDSRLKEISLDLVRVTEAAAIAASKWVGSGDKLAADHDATEAMRDRLNYLPFRGVVRIGEGKKDQSHGLFKGDRLGSTAADAYEYDLAVDPIDGTTPTVTSGPEATSVLAVAERGSMFDTDEFYMLKLAVGPEVAAAGIELSLERPLEETLRAIAAVLNQPVAHLTVCMLNRPRHEAYIRDIRRLGTRLKLIQDCDISGAIACCLPEREIDLLFGIGGAPEAVLSAAAVKCFGGRLLGQVWRDGTLLGPVLAEEELVRGACAFAATGITNGSLLSGVRWTTRGPMTSSVFCRSVSQTIRWIRTWHGN
jgi:fructose-1,6-bisphosphatase II